MLQLDRVNNPIIMLDWITQKKGMYCNILISHYNPWYQCNISSNIDGFTIDYTSKLKEKRYSSIVCLRHPGLLYPLLPYLIPPLSVSLLFYHFIYTQLATEFPSNSPSHVNSLTRIGLCLPTILPQIHDKPSQIGGLLTHHL